MKRILSFLAAVLTIAALWCGCDADVDLNNIDKDVKVDANLAFPVGTAKVTLGDFVGDGTWGIFVDSLDNTGVLVFKDTFGMARNFHKVELSSYISKTSLQMNMYDKVGGTIVGSGTTIPLEFPLSLKLSGINQDQSYQRLDSALIKNASFVSKISQSGGMPLDWDWIERVTITLGNAFSRAQGNEVEVYSKGQGYGYGQEIPINVDEFSMNLMKDKNPLTPEAYGNDNVVDSCDFKVTIYVNIPEAAGVIAVPSSASFQYDLDVQFIDYYAIWGMFKASSDMSDENEVSLTQELGVWKMFESATLPFAEPKIDVKITTHIAGALMVKGDYLYVQEDGGAPVYATFDGNRSMYKYFNPNEYLGLDSEIGDSATMHVLFDKDPARGCLDKLFTVKPDRLGYKFSVDFFRQETPQIRVTDNTDIRINAECELPMIFNEGVSVAISDTIHNINLSALTLDSLLQDAPEIIDTINEAALTLALQIENSIPLQFKASFVCLDENGDVVIDPQTNNPLLLTDSDTILIPAPDHQFTQSTSSWAVTPSQMTATIKVDDDKLNTLAAVKQIIFRASLDDESLAHAYDQGHFNVKLTKYEGLSVKIGIGASLDAVLDLNSVIE